MKDEFDQLLKLVVQAGEVVRPDFNELLLRSLHFFQSMRNEFVEASASERKELVEQLKSMHDRLYREFQKTMKKNGFTEDQLTNYLEDSKFFNEMQKEMLAKSRKEVEETKKSVSRKTKSKKSSDNDVIPTSRKSKWMKS